MLSRLKKIRRERLPTAKERIKDWGLDKPSSYWCIGEDIKSISSRNAPSFDGSKPEHQLVIETTNGTELILDEATVNKLCDALDEFLLTGLCS